jgi:hypothetical protein
MHVSLIPPSSASLEAPAISSPSVELEVPFCTGLFGRLLLNLSRLVGLFALEIREDQLPQLHELLNLLFHNLVADLKGFHAPIARLRHAPKSIQDGLLARELLTLKAGRAERTKCGV